MKLLIAIPTRDYMHFEFVKRLTDLIQKLDEDEINYKIAYQGSTLVYIGRDKLARKAIDEGFSHVLWLDSDMVFESTLLDDLMFSGKSFVTGIAHGRRAPHFSCIFKEVYPKVDRWEYKDYPSTTFKIGGCGFACVLIETRILKAVWDKHGTCFFPTRELGEDVAFCVKARECGFEIYAEPTVRLGHIGHITIYPEYSETYASSIQNFNEVMNNGNA